MPPDGRAEIENVSSVTRWYFWTLNPLFPSGDPSSKKYHSDFLYVVNIVACHLPRAPSLRWREDMSGGLPNVRGYDTNSNQITNNSIKYTLLSIYAHTKLTKGVGRDKM